ASVAGAVALACGYALPRKVVGQKKNVMPLLGQGQPQREIVAGGEILAHQEGTDALAVDHRRRGADAIALEQRIKRDAQRRLQQAPRLAVREKTAKSRRGNAGLMLAHEIGLLLQLVREPQIAGIEKSKETAIGGRDGAVACNRRAGTALA